MTDIAKLKRDIVFTVPLCGSEFTFHSTWGLFSPRRVDDGSYLLIKHLDLADADVSIDLGCGYGAIGIAAARLSPAGRVHLVDKDYVALAYARKNADVNGLANCEVYSSNAFSEVPADVRFDNVLANLPAKTGKEMLAIILHDAHARLKPGGPKIVDDNVRKNMKAALARIQDGSFAKQWLDECKAGKANFKRLYEEDKNHPIEVVGRQLRKMFAWMEAKEAPEE